MIDYVCGFAFSADTLEVMLIEKQKPEWQRGQWNGVGGKIEPGETPYEAMAREFQEETGLAVPATHWEPFAVLTGPDYRVCFFRALAVPIRHCLTTTDERVQRWAVDSLPDKMIANLRWLIPFALQSHNYRLVLLDAKS